MKFYLKRRQRSQILATVSIISFILLYVSCQDSSKTSTPIESELITKINKVQEQVMAQGHISKEEEEALLGLCSIVSHNDGLANYDPEERMLLKDVEFAPIYAGCEELSKDETMTCFKDKVSAFIKREFNLELSKALHLSEPKHVDVFFIINTSGNVTGLKVRNSEVTIQGEILRVLRKLPVMQPALHDGHRVSVLCSVVINYGNQINIDFVYIPEIPDA